MSESIYDYVEPIETGGYKVIRYKSYYSKRYNNWLEITVDDKPYDGATGAFDIDSFGWLFHDVMCRDGCFTNGAKCSNWQASQVLSDILKSEGRWVRSKTWPIATWLFGGGRARKNGLF